MSWGLWTFNYPAIQTSHTCRIGIPWHDRESNDTLILGFMVAIFLQKFEAAVRHEGRTPFIVGHFHEWQAGVGLIMSR